MDRNIVYPGSIPLDTDILQPNRSAMVGISALTAAVIGSNTIVDGLACIPTLPASLTVSIGPGSITQLTAVDASSYGSLAADVTDQIVKTGINLKATSFPLTAPVNSGQSINYLIEAAFSETDTNPVVLPYVNAANTSQPYSGPNNSGTAQNTQRIQRVQLQVKPGAAAAAGTQTTPAVDSGWVGLYIITVNYGQSAVTAANISVAPGAPFLTYKLPALRPGFSAMQVFTASGNFTVPNGVTAGRVTVIGGGGAGGYHSTMPSGGGGGSGQPRKWHQWRSIELWRVHGSQWRIWWQWRYGIQFFKRRWGWGNGFGRTGEYHRLGGHGCNCGCVPRRRWRRAG